MKEDVQYLLMKHKIVLVRVLASMTQLFQPLDFTVNVYFKNYMRNKLSESLSKEILKQFKQGMSVVQVKVDLKLTVIKLFECKHLKVKKLSVMAGCVLVFLTLSIWGIIYCRP